MDPDHLVVWRAKLIEEGFLIPGEPLPGHNKAELKLPPKDLCPACNGLMTFYRRRGYICRKCNKLKP